MLRSDKGNATSLINKTRYITKLGELLSNTNFNVTLNSHPKKITQNKSNNIFKKFKDNSIITKEKYKKLTCNNKQHNFKDLCFAKSS